ncbi:hypothetical protein [Actinophytocola sediminis]
MRNGTRKIAIVVIGLAGVIATSGAVASASVSAAQPPGAALSASAGDDVTDTTPRSDGEPPREGGDMHW